MKIGIVTFHRANNYGAVLQAYALQQAVAREGRHCEIVDYRNPNIEPDTRLFADFHGNLKKLAGRIANQPIRLARKKVFDTFLKERLTMSRSYTAETVAEADACFDSFIFGSDQIWNGALTGNDRNYLGAFVSENRKRNAYAASFGETQIPEEARESYQKELSAFQNLSVRESSGQQRLLELIGKDARLVTDPVFLLDKGQWQGLASARKTPEKYIFLYHLQGKSTKIMEYAQYLSRKTGLPIVEFQAWVKLRKGNVKPVFAGAPEDFLALIQNATYVVTDSFHATAFSVIFEKAFWSGISPNKEAKDTRVGNLLLELGLSDRLLPKDSADWRYTNKPDYTATRECLNRMMEDSRRYISSVLEGVPGDTERKDP
ncbi:MAG: polysaccharide pyruvyl transferase family protein [Ruminococcaceae bacterium]|nr:polysaccharide pyruvyl transferase family protein [Oscillospiraceae bacterium]